MSLMPESVMKAKPMMPDMRVKSVDMTETGSTCTGSTGVIGRCIGRRGVAVSCDGTGVDRDSVSNCRACECSTNGVGCHVIGVGVNGYGGSGGTITRCACCGGTCMGWHVTV